MDLIDLTQVIDLTNSYTVKDVDEDGDVTERTVTPCQECDGDTDAIGQCCDGNPDIFRCPTCRDAGCACCACQNCQQLWPDDTIYTDRGDAKEGEFLCDKCKNV